MIGRRVLAAIADWVVGMRAVWDELDRLYDEPAPPAAPIPFYGRLGEMGHEDDRADDWPGADTGVTPPER